MVSTERYNALYDHYQHAQDVAAVLFFLLLLVLMLCVVFVSLYTKERGRRRTLQTEINRQQSPAHQLEMIQSLGAAGREELRQLVVDAHQAMATVGGGRRR